MPLTPGSRLGPYEILSLLGTGGMGEVYRARDTRLGRNVAIKILPDALSADPHFRDRFDREARAVSQLDHPHICALYDVGEHDGTAFLVMQYLEGETLADRLQKGAPPLELALRTAIEIADALDKAHRAGIVHRDLKPANIMLISTGAKLLDFGLAKAVRQVISAAGPSMAPTTPPSLTMHGAILGTLQYMAPEQLEGREADGRTDIFAFGAVLYEMVTGKKAFEGKSQASLIAAILDAHPPSIAALRPLIPPALTHVVETCLAKDPDARWQSAGDLARELRWIAKSSAGPAATKGSGGSGWRLRSVATVLAAFVSGAALAFIISRTPEPARGPTSVIRTALPLPAGASFTFDSTSSLALSPDGKHLAYALARGGPSQMYLRALDEPDAKIIPGTDDGYGAFFSPDSRWLGFTTHGKLMKVALSGGMPQTICDAPNIYGATWGPDDTIVFSEKNAGLFTVSAAGGTARALTIPDRAKHEKSHRFPHFLPDGKAVLFTLMSADISSYDESSIAVVSRETGKIRTLPAAGTNPVFVSSGHLVYVRGASLMVAPFDLRTREITGPSATVLEGVNVNWFQGSAAFSVANGSLAYLRAGRSSDAFVRYVDREGRSSPVLDDRRLFEELKLSPDAKRLALSVAGANDQIWVYDLVRRTLSRLTFGWDNFIVGWTPDGERLTIQSDRAQNSFDLFWQAVESPEPAERLTDNPTAHPDRGSWSPDGKLLAFTHQTSPATGADIWLLELGPKRKTRPLIQTPFDESQPTFSPDGRWLTYVSHESGRNEVYMQPFPGLGRKWQLSTDGGDQPVWARNGRELFYINGHKLMAVSIRTGPTFVAGEPQLLFERSYQLYPYDVTPDGRFIMIEPAEPEVAPTEITLVQNWTEELKQRVPAR